MLNVSELKCKLAAAVYSKMTKEAYGIKDCCGQYDEDEVEDERLLISLYCGPFNIDDIKNGFKEPKKKKPGKIKVKPQSLFIHSQTSASDFWTVNHNLGYNPNVTVFNEDNEKIIGTVTYTSANTLQITFSTAQSGKAYLS